MIAGSCLCGRARFQVDGTFEHMSHCHCSMCRKAHGAAFATYATCRPAQFSWTSGEDAVVQRQSSPGITRAFCRHCGSALPIVSNQGVHVPVGCLDDDPQMIAQKHIFTASAAPWHIIADSLPRHDTWDAGRASVHVTDAVLGAAPDKVLRGSCLCGNVAFEVVQAFKRAHNCHCSRCRKARAAAHTSNAFTSFAGVHFTHGEEHVEVYKLPGAKHFAVAFCRTCGSGVPRKDSARDIAVVPMGALDDDPHCTVNSHIYVGSKASWYSPQDDLLKFDGAAG